MCEPTVFRGIQNVIDSCAWVLLVIAGIFSFENTTFQRVRRVCETQSYPSHFLKRSSCPYLPLSFLVYASRCVIKSQAMVGIYLIVFGVLLLIFELWAPHQVWAYMSFLRTHFGKGITLIFLGCIGGGTDALGLAVLILVLVVGFLHVIVSFTQPSHLVPCTRRPTTQLDNLTRLCRSETGGLRPVLPPRVAKPIPVVRGREDEGACDGVTRTAKGSSRYAERQWSKQFV